MKNFELKSISLENFRGQSRKIDLSKVTEIRGKNDCGKSTVMNAFLWLFTGADSEDRINYQLFDNRVEQTPENSKLVNVDAKVVIDGIEYVFKKTAKVGWTRKKESVVYERKGTDVYKFYIDDIERGATEYKTFIENIFCPIDKLKIILNTQYFLSLEWKEMRKQFEELIGEIKEDDFKGDYSNIVDLIAKFGLDTKMMKDSLKPKIKILEENVGNESSGKKGKLQIQIETMENNLPDITGLELIDDKISELKKEIELIDKEILGKSDKVRPFIEKRENEQKEIHELEEELFKMRLQYENPYNSPKDALLQEWKKLKDENTDIERRNLLNKMRFDNLAETLKSEEKKLSRLNEYRNQLLKQNNEVKAMVFLDDKCPYCGQVLPEDKLEESRKKFNEIKESKHNAIVAEGKANNLTIQQTKESIAKIKSEIEEGFKEEPLHDLSDIQAKIDDLKAKEIPFEQSIGYKDKVAEIERKKADLTIVPDIDNTKLSSRKSDIMDEISSLSKKFGRKDDYDYQMQKIESLRNELRESACQLAELEGKKYSVEEYEREKASIISYRVNRLFDYVQVKMTDTNKSGDLVDTCIVTDNKGVNSTTTNFASKIRCSIDISNAFAKFYEINAPLFIDFAESINEDNYPELDRQMVKLIVDECDFSVINK